MEAKQVIFRCPNTDVIESTKDRLGGLAIYDECNRLQCVVCGCCGGIFEPKDITIVRKLDWIPISAEIIGE